MKRIAALILAMLMVLPMAACGDSNIDVGSSSGSSSGTPSGTTAEYTIKVGHTLQEDTPSHKAFQVFEEEVEKNSNGRIAVALPQLLPGQRARDVRGLPDGHPGSCLWHHLRACQL